MVLRIKSRWRVEKRNAVTAETLEENAGALAFITWRLSLEGAKGLHGEGFEYLSDRERVGVITEFVAFLVQCADRLAYARLEACGARPQGRGERAIFVNALAQRLADQIQDNLVDIAGPGNYRRPFIEALNARLADYAELGFEEEPLYDTLRYFGAHVLAIMRETQTNRWVIDQVMSIDGPACFEKLRDAMGNLFETGSGAEEAGGPLSS